MKVKLIHMAMLMFFVMSVVFLAQVQEGIGHSKPYDPNVENSPPPHKPPGHTHKPSIKVDSNGNPVTSGGCDPRGNLYSGTCGNAREGYLTAWGIRYWGGKYSPSPGDEDNATQNVYAVRIDIEASTGSRHARVKVTPGIDQLRQYPYTTGNWQGAASGLVKFSGVCFHTGLLCIKHSRSGDYWRDTGFIDMAVSIEKISKGEKKTYGAGFESNGASLTANSEHTYTASYEQLNARGYRFLIELKGSWWDSYPKLQNKYAIGDGQLMDDHIKSETASAIYNFTDWEDCYCGDSKEPLFW